MTSPTPGSDDWRQQLADLLLASGDAGVEGSRDLADQVIDLLVSAGWQPPGSDDPSEQMLIPHDQAFHIPAEWAQVAADLGYGHLLHECPEGAHDD